MKQYPIVKVYWMDIQAETNKSRYGNLDLPVNIATGILYEKFKDKGIEYIKLLTNAVITDDLEATNTDDLLLIPTGCIKEIKILDKVFIGKKIKVIKKEDLKNGNKI